jgi:hypothetical protein
MYVHGANLAQKEAHKTKYMDKDAQKYLGEIRIKYDVWRAENEKLKGPLRAVKKSDDDTLKKRVALLNEYKDFVDQQHYAEKFDSRSNLHSSILEEFLYYLFADLAKDFSEHALIGKSHTFKDIFFMPNSFEEMLTRPTTLIETKDHDWDSCRNPNEMHGTKRFGSGNVGHSCCGYRVQNLS